MLKVNDIIKFHADAYTDSEVVGEFDGYKVFVRGLIVGETADVKINYIKRNVAYGDLIKVTAPSPQRVNAICPHYGVCGGCSLMHMSYDEQLVFKRNKVERNLCKIGGIAAKVLPCVTSPLQMGYRNKLSLPVSGKKGRVKIGMYQRASHDVVDMCDCKLGGDWSLQLVEVFRKYFNEVGVEPYNEKTFNGDVRHIVARYVDGQLLAVIVSNGAYKRTLTPLIELLNARFEHFGLFINENTLRNNVIMGNKTTHVYGIECIEGVHFGIKYRLRPNSFFQVNDDVKNLIYAKAKQLLDVSRTELVVDLFSGIGILTNALCSDNYDTIAVEIEPSAVTDANEMARINNAPRLTNLQGDAHKLLPKITAEHKGKRMSLVVDPPRKGLGEDICKTVVDAGFDNIVYISCDSATLARDLALLADSYDVRYVQPYDMFPNTDQVECVCLLTKVQN